MTLVSLDILFCLKLNTNLTVCYFSLLGRINFEIEASNSTNIVAVVNVKDKAGQLVASKATTASLNGFVDVSNAMLWWPYLMSSDPGYLYTFEVIG